MTLGLLFYLSISAFVFAALEIQIEGKNGWAEKLPTWRVKNPFSRIIAWPYIDGYHLYLWILLALLFHLPYFFGLEFSWLSEIVIVESFFIFSFVEDFLWFVLNPHWGIKKFIDAEIPWHGKKFLNIPQNIWFSILVIFIFEVLRGLIIR